MKAEQAASGQPGPTDAIAWLWDRLHDPDDPDASIAEALSDRTSYAWSVATYNDPFELRKLHMQLTISDGVTVVDDVRVMTFHFIKLVSGSPSSAWVQADFDALVARFDTFWASAKALYRPSVKLDRYKFYKAGPAITPPQVPVYDLDRDIAGSQSSGAQLPPQVALSVTEKAGSKRFWGRFYLPAPATGYVGLYGRPDPTYLPDIADWVDTLYTGCKADGLPIVVYRPALPARQTAREIREGLETTSLAARGASAWTVDDIQIDDVFDVIRSRRFKEATLRVQRAIT